MKQHSIPEVQNQKSMYSGDMTRIQKQDETITKHEQQNAISQYEQNTNTSITDDFHIYWY